MSTILASAVTQFLDEHRKHLRALLGGDETHTTYQVQIHTLAGIARMFPEQAALMQIMVKPKKGEQGSTVMSSVLEIGGQWFDFEGAQDRDALMKRIRDLARLDDDGKTQEISTIDQVFNETIEARLPVNEHSLIQPYIAKHLPACVAAHTAAGMKIETENIVAAGSVPRF